MAMEPMSAYDMQLELNTIGYDWDYLETLSNSALERIYKEEFL